MIVTVREKLARSTVVETSKYRRLLVPFVMKTELNGVAVFVDTGWSVKHGPYGPYLKRAKS